jgi:hypothetical protein
LKFQFYLYHNLGQKRLEVKTVNELYFVGGAVVFTVTDIDALPADVRKVARAITLEEERQVRELGRLFKTAIEEKLGRQVNLDDYMKVIEETERDIRINRLAYGKATTMKDLINIAATMAEALARCG